MSNKGPPRAEIWKMFDTISSTYDKTNRVMTFGFDLYWRKKMSHFLPRKPHIHLLDCATGTGDQIFSLFKYAQNITEAVGIDLSKDMIRIGKEKLRDKHYKNQVVLREASALEIPFKDETFDCVTMSFGIRNVTDVSLCLKELKRVLKPGGRVLILETSIPENRILKTMHLFYLRHILPKLGGWISKHKEAYQYLNQTTETFPSGDAFCSLLETSGFSDVKAHPLTLGAVSIYQADKK